MPNRAHDTLHGTYSRTTGLTSLPYLLAGLLCMLSLQVAADDTRVERGRYL